MQGRAPRATAHGEALLEQARSPHPRLAAGRALGVPYEQTSSCYDPGADGRSCGDCDS